MIELKIDKYRIVENESKKPFCVYIVEGSVNGRKFAVEKRYSQFHALHGELRKLYTTPNFPPKKVRSLQQKVLENRKLVLERYLQIMLKFNQSRSHVLSFLGINKQEQEKSGCEPEKSNGHNLDYPPFFQFKKDFIPQTTWKSNIPDILVEGVFHGIYKTS